MVDPVRNPVLDAMDQDAQNDTVLKRDRNTAYRGKSIL